MSDATLSIPVKVPLENDDDPCGTPPTLFADRTKHYYQQWRTIRKATQLSARLKRPISAPAEPSQAGGHKAGFKRTAPGSVCKKYSEGEYSALKMLMTDQHLASYVPQVLRVVEEDGEKWVQMQDLLISMYEPHVMDIKLGVRTYLEEESDNSKPRKDLLLKILKFAQPEEVGLSGEELANGVTKLRFMQTRDNMSSSSSLGFRICGISHSSADHIADDALARIREPDQLIETFKNFLCEGRAHAPRILARLKSLRAAFEQSDVCSQLEFIGSSILVVYDVRSDKCGVWMIDFGKTLPVPGGHRLTHRQPWELGNHEDGYLTGLDNVIRLWEQTVQKLEIPQPCSPEEALPEETKSPEKTHDSVGAGSVAEPPSAPLM